MIGSREPTGGASRPYARIQDGPGLPGPVVERLLCAGRIRTAVRDGAEVLALGRTRRLVTARQFRALLLRHEGQCAHPGCRNRARLHAHHVRHWLSGGRTDMSNLVLLCEPHHLAHHEGEFTIAATGKRGRFRFARADGLALEEHYGPDDVGTSREPIEDEHGGVAPAAATGGWRGERLDHHYATSVLAQHLHHRRPA